MATQTYYDPQYLDRKKPGPTPVPGTTPTPQPPGVTNTNPGTTTTPSATPGWPDIPAPAPTPDQTASTPGSAIQSLLSTQSPTYSYDPTQASPNTGIAGGAPTAPTSVTAAPAGPTQAAAAAPADVGGGGQGGIQDNPSDPTSAPDPQNPTYQDYQTVRAWYKQYLGRDATDQEALGWINSRQNWGTIQNQIQTSAEAQAYTKKQATPPPTTPNGQNTWDPANPHAWIDAALAGAKSTDDPNYWYQKIMNDPNVQNASTRDSALAYWQDRINRGDGSGLGLPKFQDGGSGTGTGSGGTGSLGGNGQSGLANQAQWDALYAQLMQRAGQSLQVNAKDPIIANQVNAYQATADRANRNQLAGLAESQGPDSNLNMETRMGNQSVAQSTGQLQASLIQNELTARRTEIQNALSQAGSMLSSEQQLALQQQLGLLDASLRQLQIGNQNSQFYAGLGQANNQFLDTYGFNQWDRQNYWDWMNKYGVPPA